MALSCVNLTGSDQGSGSSITTGSITPTANKLCILNVTSKLSSGTPNTPTATGNNLTWVQIATQLSADNHQRTTNFRAMGSAPSAGSVSVAFGAQTQDGANWCVDQFTGADTSGTNGSGAVRQSIGGTNAGTSTGITLTLSSFLNAMNSTYGYVFINSVQLITQGGSFTEIQESGGTSGEGESQFAANNQTSVPWTWASASLTSTAIAVEIQSLNTSNFFSFFNPS